MALRKTHNFKRKKKKIAKLSKNTQTSLSSVQNTITKNAKKTEQATRPKGNQVTLGTAILSKKEQNSIAYDKFRSPNCPNAEKPFLYHI